MKRWWIPMIVVLALVATALLWSAGPADAEVYLVKVIDGEEHKYLGFRDDYGAFISCHGNEIDVAEGDRIVASDDHCPEDDDTPDVEIDDP